MKDKITERIRRIYAAIDEALTTDASEFSTVTRQVDGNTYATGMNFQGGLSSEQLQNIVYTAIHNTASLRDHLKGWARRNDKTASDIDDIVDASLELKVIIDLWNRDKHGGAPRDGGLSGFSPDLVGFRRAVVLPAHEEGNEKPTLTVNLFGDKPEVEFKGGAHVSTNADIVSGEGDRLGDAMAFLEISVSKWEAVLAT